MKIPKFDNTITLGSLGQMFLMVVSVISFIAVTRSDIATLKETQKQLVIEQKVISDSVASLEYQVIEVKTIVNERTSRKQ